MCVLFSIVTWICFYFFESTINIYSIAWIHTTIIVSPMIKLSEYKQRAHTHTDKLHVGVPFRTVHTPLKFDTESKNTFVSFAILSWMCETWSLYAVRSGSTQTRRRWLFALIMIFFLRSIWAIVHAYKIIACNTVYVYGLRTVHMYSGRVLSTQWLATIFKTTDKLIANCPHALMCECLSKSQKIKTKLNVFPFK